MATPKKPRRTSKKNFPVQKTPKKASKLEISDLNQDTNKLGELIDDVALSDPNGSATATHAEPQEPAKETIMASTLERASNLLGIPSENLMECLKAIGVENSKEGLKKLTSEDLSRDILIKHVKGWNWLNHPDEDATPTQAQVLGAVILLKNAKLDSQVGEVRPVGSNDEVEALSTCWEQPDLTPEMRRMVGLIDTSNRDTLTETEKKASRITSFSQSLGQPIKMTKIDGGEWELAEKSTDSKTTIDVNNGAVSTAIKKACGESYPVSEKMLEKVCEKAPEPLKPHEHVAYVGDSHDGQVMKITKKPGETTFTKEWVPKSPNPPYEAKSVEISNRTKYLLRINDAAGLLQEKPEDVQSILEQSGMKLEMLDVQAVTAEGLIQILGPVCKAKDMGRLMRAARILKGIPRNIAVAEDESYDGKKFIDQTPKETRVIKQLDVPQMGDEELVRKFNDHREPDVAWELDRRAKGQPFIVLTGNSENSKEELDVEYTVQWLRMSRRKTNPDMIDAVDYDIPLYSARDMVPANRVIELCPMCKEHLYKGWCEMCQRSMTAANRLWLTRPARLPKIRATAEKVEVLVPANGKTVGKFRVPFGVSADRLEAEALNVASEHIKDVNGIRKVVVIPDKLVNLITN